MIDETRQMVRRRDDDDDGDVVKVEEDVEVDTYGAVVRGRGGDAMEVRRVGKRGGAFEVLTVMDGQVPGEAARSIEGWVLFVSGLPKETSEDDIRDAFCVCGELRNVRMNLTVRDAQCIGHAFVEFTTKDACITAVQTLHNKPFLSAEVINITPAFIVPMKDEDEEHDEVMMNGDVVVEGELKRDRE